jgi:uncharacterized protein (DUF427 family)
MSTRVFEAITREFSELRYEPIRKRVRATLGDDAVVDSTRAMVVWEPRRVVPSYAVPVEDVRGELVPARSVDALNGEQIGYRVDEPALAGRTILDPSHPFAIHTADGEALSFRAAGATRDGVAFRPTDPDLAGHVILDFDGFDAWYEEDVPVVAHARDPFHRIDVLPSSRHVRIELDGELLAESSQPRLLFEGPVLPVRAYLAREDVRVPMRSSDKRTRCAYKGEASYWSFDVGGRTVEDLAWSYEAPLLEAAEVAGRIAFFNERVDVIIDGERQQRPHTPWS